MHRLPLRPMIAIAAVQAFFLALICVAAIRFPDKPVIHATNLAQYSPAQTSSAK